MIVVAVTEQSTGGVIAVKKPSMIVAAIAVAEIEKIPKFQRNPVDRST